MEEVCASAYSEGEVNFYFEEGNHFIMIDSDKYKDYSDSHIFEFFRTSNFRITIKYDD